MTGPATLFTQTCSVHPPISKGVEPGGNLAVVVSNPPVKACFILICPLLSSVGIISGDAGTQRSPEGTVHPAVRSKGVRSGDGAIATDVPNTLPSYCGLSLQGSPLDHLGTSRCRWYHSELLGNVSVMVYPLRFYFILTWGCLANSSLRHFTLLFKSAVLLLRRVKISYQTKRN